MYVSFVVYVPRKANKPSYECGFANVAETCIMQALKYVVNIVNATLNRFIVSLSDDTKIHPRQALCKITL